MENYCNKRDKWEEKESISNVSRVETYGAEILPMGKAL
jgi:hypothetical protein